MFGQQKNSKNVGIVDNQHKSNILVSSMAMLPMEKISNVEMMERRKKKGYFIIVMLNGAVAMFVLHQEYS